MFTISVEENTVYQAAERYVETKHPEIKPDNYELDLSTAFNDRKQCDMHHVTIWINNRFIVGWQADTLEQLAAVILEKSK